jgi:hypothetical protein
MRTRGKLPLGKSTFRDIRLPENNYLYVDKTQFVHDLVTNGTYYFLSRPRRFGKSLFVDTLSELFEGSKELFEGLYIYDKWDWSQSFPVVRIDLADGIYNSVKSIEEYLLLVVERNARRLELEFRVSEKHNLGALFTRFIYEINQKYNQKVVILIDEYDKPIIDNLQSDKKEIAAEARNILRGFYSAIKVSDAYVRFVFMTGVSKFTQMSLFSGLNNLNDITIDARYSSIAGYTQSDLETIFADYLEGVDKEEVRRWYNGYNFLGEPVYNPYDILKFFDKGNLFENFWWETGGTQMLIDKLADNPYYIPDLENIVVSNEILKAFDVEHIDMVALLWQTGYLTFVGYEGDPSDGFFRLKVPNLEVQRSLNHLIFQYLSNISASHATYSIKTKNSINKADFSGFKIQLSSLFAALPYQNYVNNHLANYEGYYASVVYTFLASLGFNVIAEDTTNTGRIDMTLLTPNSIVILEFKVDQAQEAALEQIKTKRYYEKYLSENKEIYLIGIHFSSEKKNIEGFVWERFVK